MQRCGVVRRKGPRVYPVLRFTPGDTPVGVSTLCVCGLERLWCGTGVARSVSGRLVAGYGCDVSPRQPRIADDGDDTGHVGGITPLSGWTLVMRGDAQWGGQLSRWSGGRLSWSF
jgi:hypothetical protein